MSDYLTRLAERAVGALRSVRPRVPLMFENSAGVEELQQVETVSPVRVGYRGESVTVPARESTGRSEVKAHESAIPARKPAEPLNPEGSGTRDAHPFEDAPNPSTPVARPGSQTKEAPPRRQIPTVSTPPREVSRPTVLRTRRDPSEAPVLKPRVVGEPAAERTPAEQVIQVTIGRIDVHAVAPSMKAVPAVRKSTAMTLDEYLARQRRV
jgi:hypothetical protein